MKTRSGKESQGVEILAKNSATPSKIQKTNTPKKQNKEDALTSLIKSIQKENAAPKLVEAEGVDSKVGNDDKNPSAPTNKVVPKVIRGKPKSGRPWKEVKQKFSKIKKSVHRPSFQKKEQLRNEIKHIKELSKSIKEDKRLENVAKKERREENAKRRLENERKNEIVQVIKNPAKLKRMKKKALRKIEKRDLTAANGPKVV